MDNLEGNSSPESENRKGTRAVDLSLLEELPSLSGGEALDRILEHPDPGGLIKALPDQDFFWLMKRMGEDCTQLLRLASQRQWQYILDLELWEKDRLDLAHTFRWLQRLERAHPGRLVKWLFGEGQSLAYLFFFRSVRVDVRDEDEAYDLENGFVTLDGLFYVKVNRKEERDTIERILKQMAHEDLLRYHSLLMGLAGVIPAEMEEEMYRLRNVRIAEHGFLPREEALLVYSPVDIGAVKSKDPRSVPQPLLDEDLLDLAPYTPFHLSEVPGLLMESASRITDPRALERIRLEFAGLCNQILSADGLVVHDPEELKRTGRKAAAYLNLTLEELSGTDMGKAQAVLEENALVTLFRAGFGLALKLKWEAERWLRESWFDPGSMGYGFWGEAEGNTLSGLVAKYPRYYCGPEGEEEYREFERVSDLEEVGAVLHRLMALDRLLARLAETFPLDREDAGPRSLTCHALLFTLWARQMLDLEPCFDPLSLEEARDLFQLLRKGDNGPPFQMLGFEEVFVKDFLDFVPDLDPEQVSNLKEALTLIWQEFSEEYERVETRQLDPRFSNCLPIRAS